MQTLPLFQTIGFLIFKRWRAPFSKQAWDWCELNILQHHELKIPIVCFWRSYGVLWRSKIWLLTQLENHFICQSFRQNCFWCKIKWAVFMEKVSIQPVRNASGVLSDAMWLTLVKSPLKTIRLRLFVKASPDFETSIVPQTYIYYKRFIKKALSSTSFPGLFPRDWGKVLGKKVGIVFPYAIGVFLTIRKAKVYQATTFN